MKLHPVHLLFVHFPSALLPIDLVFMGLSSYFNNESLAYAGYYCLLAGVIGGWVSVLTGLFDLFLYVLKPGSPALNKALTHASIQSCMILGFTIVASFEYNHSHSITAPSTWLWFTKAILFSLMIAGNFFGAEVLLRFVSKRF